MKYPKGTRMLVVENNGHNFPIGSIVEVIEDDLCMGYCKDRDHKDPQWVVFGVEVILVDVENE